MDEVRLTKNIIDIQQRLERLESMELTQKSGFMGALIRRAVDFNVGASSSVTIVWASELYDTADMWDVSDDTKLYLPAKGLWLIYCRIHWAGGGSDARRVKIAINGTIEASKRNVEEGQIWGHDVTYLHRATVATDYATFIAQNEDSSTRSVDASDDASTHAFAFRMPSN